MEPQSCELVNFGDLNMYVSDSESADSQQARRGGPTKCIVQNPTTRSAYFNGRFISLTEISRFVRNRVSLSMLSRVFRGERIPSLRSAAIIAEALGMDCGDFVEAYLAQFP